MPNSYAILKFDLDFTLQEEPTMNDVFANPASLEEALEPGSTKKKNWAAFIESDAVHFFNRFAIEKMTLDDGRGN